MSPAALPAARPTPVAIPLPAALPAPVDESLLAPFLTLQTAALAEAFQEVERI